MHKNHTQDINSASQTPKRSLQISPTENPISPEQAKIVKAPKMTQYADKNDIQEIKDLFRTTINKFQEQFTHINNNLISLKNEMIAANTELSNIKSRVEILENAGSIDKQNSDMLSTELNALKQIQIDSQLSIHNVPQNIETKHALECLSEWANIDLNDGNIKRSSIVKLKSKNSSILFLDFYNIATKHKFMKHVRLMQKDKDKKHIPVLTEHVFKLEPTNTSRGIELHFRDAMTDVNREIFNAARKHKKFFTSVWISRGYIMVRINNEKPTKINSINHLNSLLASHRFS